MTNEQDLLENIRKRSVSDLKDMSTEQYKELLGATISAIDKVLETGDSISIDDFGLFSRRKQGGVSVSFFKAAYRLNDRINRKK
jgi:nucleoid DNA-binding protein